MRASFTYVLCCLWLPIAGLAQGADDAAIARDHGERVLRALEQGALVHGMAQAACFDMAGLENIGTGDIAMDLRDTYQTSLDAFVDGHEWLGLLPTDDPAELAAIARVRTMWEAYGPAIAQIVHGDYHSVVMAQILSRASSTADASIKLAREFLTLNGTGNMTPEVAEALLLAGRYRLMSERALMETCFALNDIGGDTQKYILQFTLEEMDTILTTLKEGGDGISPPPNARIERNFRTALLFWNKMVPVMEQAIAGETPDETAIRKMLKFNQSVQKQLNQALAGYLTAGA